MCKTSTDTEPPCSRWTPTIFQFVSVTYVYCSISSPKTGPECSRWIQTTFPFGTVMFPAEHIVYENWTTVLQVNEDRLSLCASDAILNAVGYLRILLNMKSDQLWRLLQCSWSASTEPQCWCDSRPSFCSPSPVCFIDTCCIVHLRSTSDGSGLSARC